MDQLIMIEGDTLTWLIDRIRVITERVYPYRLRIAVDEGELKVKFDEYSWSPPIGPAKSGDDAR